jgi:hypothetical protein
VVHSVRLSERIQGPWITIRRYRDWKGGRDEHDRGAILDNDQLQGGIQDRNCGLTEAVYTGFSS